MPATVGRSWVVTAAMACAGYCSGGSSSNHTSRYESTPASARWLAHRRLDRAEVLADDRRRPARTALERQHGEQLVGRVAHVGAVGGGAGRRDPEQAEQAHHVVDAQAAGAGERAPATAGRAAGSRRPQLPGDERRQPPVLARAGEGVGRGADPDAVGEQVLQHPGVGAVGVDADGQVGEQGQRLAGRGELDVEQALQPRPEPDPVGAWTRRTSRRRATSGCRNSLGHGDQPDPWCSARAQKVA